MVLFFFCNWFIHLFHTTNLFHRILSCVNSGTRKKLHKKMMLMIVRSFVHWFLYDKKKRKKKRKIIRVFFSQIIKCNQWMSKKKSIVRRKSLFRCFFHSIGFFDWEILRLNEWMNECWNEIIFRERKKRKVCEMNELNTLTTTTLLWWEGGRECEWEKIYFSFSFDFDFDFQLTK